MANTRASRKRRRRLGLQGYLGGLLLTVILLTGFTLVFIGYRAVGKVTNSGIKEQVRDITTIIKKEYLNAVRQPATAVLETFSITSLDENGVLEGRQTLLPVFASFLRAHPVLNGVSVGYENGDFFVVRGLNEEKERVYFKAPPGSSFLLAEIHLATNTISKRSFFDKDMRFLGSSRQPLQKAYDPRNSLWYTKAMASEWQIKTPPMLIFGLEQPGITFARKFREGKAVVAVEILLTRLSMELESQLPSPDSHLVLLDADGELIASARDAIIKKEGEKGVRLRTTEELPTIVKLARQAYNEGMRGSGIAINDGERDWEVSLEQLVSPSGRGNILLLAIPRDVLLADSIHFLNYASLGMVGIMLFFVPFVWHSARRISRPLKNLAAKAGSIQQLLSSDSRDEYSGVVEIQALVKGMKYLQENIKNILRVIHAISSERDFDQLLCRVLKETLLMTRVDGCQVVLLDNEKKDKLSRTFKEVRSCWRVNGELQFGIRSLEGVEIDSRYASYQALTQSKIIRSSITREDPRSKVGTMEIGFADPNVDTIDLVCAPLLNCMGEYLGVLHFFKVLPNKGGGFRSDEVEFIESFAKIVGIALDNNRLLRAQKDLRDALILILAGAIDAKSPYTGGHCQRVPVIFQMLLEAACAASDGPLKGFTLSEDGWEEAKLAAWLHDCGKVTTPEYVVDKATKLETIYDRIHEIRARFEILKRDAEIAGLNEILAGADAAKIRQDLERTWQKLDEDFAFVASCNLGSECMDDEALNRLREIGGRTWLRTLDKTLGVSGHERERMARASAPAAPVLERLLMDNPEHIIERSEKDTMPPDNPWGFQVRPPEALYNRGELYNLSIRNGTLTEEERYKVNSHVERTIMMLEAIPLPRNLRKMPEIAGAHHETMDGRGYPRRLKREDMSWSARMMAIADILEALTACDRPYKPSKTLCEALEIMADLKENNHIDPDLYELFLRAEIPRRYAAKYLRKEQNDL